MNQPQQQTPQPTQEPQQQTPQPTQEPQQSTPNLKQIVQQPPHLWGWQQAVVIVVTVFALTTGVVVVFIVTGEIMDIQVGPFRIGRSSTPTPTPSAVTPTPSAVTPTPTPSAVTPELRLEQLSKGEKVSLLDSDLSGEISNSGYTSSGQVREITTFVNLRNGERKKDYEIVFEIDSSDKAYVYEYGNAKVEYEGKWVRDGGDSLYVDVEMNDKNYKFKFGE